MLEVIIMLLAMALPVIYIVRSDDGESRETEYERTRVFRHYPDGHVEEDDY